MFPSYYEFGNPVKIISGHKVLENLPYELTLLGARRPLLITDQGIIKAGLIKTVLAAFAESDIIIGALYDRVPPDSSLQTANILAHLYQETGCDALIAIGGGSVLDTAKGANIVISEAADDLRELTGADVLTRPLRPFIAIPTTAGTGSEVTPVAVIADTEHNRKMIFTSVHLLPQVAILDSRMTQTLPPFITAATAVDALAHAMEAYTCLQKNPLSDAYAWTAIRLIGDHLIDILQHPQDKEGRLALANAACMAGIAFANSMVGMVHALGHATGAVCHIPHGVAINIFLPHVLDYNRQQVAGTIGELLLPLAGADIYAITPRAERPRATLTAVRRLQVQLHTRAQLPYTLQDAGVNRAHFPDIAKMALNDGSITMNPVEMDYEDALDILERAYI
ncbi:MAG: iron-containing alcohol dehydrogenase [Anaerolineae bacterium]|nr:iron-containing alcohol dehydrogenase [Anaerolineae bacterium]